MEERWIPSEELHNYEVSDEGRVRNRKTGRILKPFVMEKGYETVTLHEDGKQYNRKVHQLVARAFCEQEDEQHNQVRHRDGDRANNRAENLEWRTKGEIARQRYLDGQKQTHRMRPVRCVETGEEFESIVACSEAMSLNRNSISKCVNNPAQKTYNGLHFEAMD